MGSLTTFDRLFAGSTPLIRDHRHQRESPPVEGGRWPVSVVLRPGPAVAARLERSMLQAETYAGPGHFRTGAADSVHFTVRALELYRETLDDEAIGRYGEALRRAARDVAPIALDLVGLTLAAGSVMACAHPVDDNAAQLMRRLGDELGEDAWREAGLERDIWYATLLHFAADIARPDELIDWVAQRRETFLERTAIDTVDLVRFHYEEGPAGRLMRPEVLVSVQTGHPRPDDPDRARCLRRLA